MQPLGRLFALLILMALSACTNPERWSIQARGLGKIIQVFPHDGVVMVVIRSRAGGADELDQQILDAYAADGVPLGDYID